MVLWRLSRVAFKRKSTRNGKNQFPNITITITIVCAVCPTQDNRIHAEHKLIINYKLLIQANIHKPTPNYPILAHTKHTIIFEQANTASPLWSRVVSVAGVPYILLATFDHINSADDRNMALDHCSRPSSRHNVIKLPLNGRNDDLAGPYRYIL